MFVYERIFLDDILEKDVDKSLYINRDDIVLDKTPVKKQLKPIRSSQVNKGGQGERIYSPYGHSITFSAFGGGARTGLYYINDKIRRLSINECKSLMGLPQNHYVAGVLKGYQQLGNSVIPQIIANIYDSIRVV
ncbi:MAG: DNA cytosine methyltransferase [Rickettsia sp.]